MLKRILAFLLAAAAPWATQPHAQGYPNKPVRVVIGYAPGGSADAGIRPLSRVLEPLLGQPMLFSSLGPAVGAVKSGKIRALGVTSLTRSAAFPDVPTFDELGIKGFDSTAWYGLLGPAGLAPEVVSRLTQAMQKAGADKNLREQINATGCDTDFLTPAQTVEKIKADAVKWGRVVKEANIRAE